MNRQIFLIIALIGLVNLKAEAGIISSTLSLTAGVPLVAAGIYLASEGIKELDNKRSGGDFFNGLVGSLEGKSDVEKFIDKNGPLIIKGTGSAVCLIIGFKILSKVGN